MEANSISSARKGLCHSGGDHCVEVIKKVDIFVADKPKKPTVVSRDMYPEEGKELIAECTFDAKPAAILEYYKVDPETNRWDRIPAQVF